MHGGKPPPQGRASRLLKLSKMTEAQASPAGAGIARPPPVIIHAGFPHPMNSSSELSVFSVFFRFFSIYDAQFRSFLSRTFR